MMKSPNTPRASSFAIFTVAMMVALSCSHTESKPPPEPAVPPSSASTPTQAPAASATPKQEKSPEYMLATIDAGGQVSENDTKVRRIRYLLKSLSERTGESQNEIANATAQTTNYIRETYGKEIKNLELMENTNKLLSSKASALVAGMTYRESAMAMAKSLID